MKLSTARCFLRLLTVLLPVLPAAAANAGDRAEALLEQAIRYTLDARIRSTDFQCSAKFPVPGILLDKDGLNIRIRFENSPDVWFTELATTAAFPGEYTWLSDTRDGMPVGKKVILRAYYRTFHLLPTFEAAGEPERLKSGTYSLGEGAYQGVPCWKVSVRYPTSDEAIGNTAYSNLEPDLLFRIYRNQQNDLSIYQRHMTPTEYAANREKIRKNYFAAMQFLIDKTPGRPFIYAITAYGISGKELYSMNWGKVEFLKSSPPGIFDVPAGASVVTSRNPQEHAPLYVKYYSEVYHKNDAPPPKRQLKNWANRTFQPANLLRWGGRIAVGAAIASVLLLIALKISARRKNR